MGVLNITPDSFSDGGAFFEHNLAIEHAHAMLEQGVDIIDIGGESTRPGAAFVPAEEELKRILPVIELIRQTSDVCISVDTWKPEVMQSAVKAGASMINDIRALSVDGALDTAASLDVPICLMHMQGMPSTMQNNPSYTKGILPELDAFFAERILACKKAGISSQRLFIDPGFGFGKTVHHNLLLLKSLHSLQKHGLPILVGFSRKSTIGHVLKTDISNRLNGSLSAAVYAAQHGASVIRTHDVIETKQALDMLDAILRPSQFDTAGCERMHSRTKEWS